MNIYKRDFWNSLANKCQTALAVADVFRTEISNWLLKNELGHAEFSLGCKYMPRGYYCPSPDIEFVITNMRRGKISQRSKNTSKPSNFYMFDKSGKVYLVETFYPNDAVQTEYILHEDNMVYGFVYDRNGKLEQLSIEEYEQGSLVQYTWAYRSLGEIKPAVHERFCYIGNKKIQTDIIIFHDTFDGISARQWENQYTLDADNKIIPTSRILVSFEEYSLS